MIMKYKSVQDLLRETTFYSKLLAQCHAKHERTTPIRNTHWPNNNSLYNVFTRQLGTGKIKISVQFSPSCTELVLEDTG